MGWVLPCRITGAFNKPGALVRHCLFLWLGSSDAWPSGSCRSGTLKYARDRGRLFYNSNISWHDEMVSTDGRIFALFFLLNWFMFACISVLVVELLQDGGHERELQGTCDTAIQVLRASIQRFLLIFSYVRYCVFLAVVSWCYLICCVLLNGALYYCMFLIFNIVWNFVSNVYASSNGTRASISPFSEHNRVLREWART